MIEDELRKIRKELAEIREEINKGDAFFKFSIGLALALTGLTLLFGKSDAKVYEVVLSLSYSILGILLMITSGVAKHLRKRR